MDKQNKFLVGAVVVALLFGVANFFKSSTTVVNNPIQAGAVTTLDGIDSPYVSIGGVKEWHGTQNMTATSTQVCRIKNPFTSTSTVVSFSARFGAGILGANKFSLGTSSAAAQGFATSTPALMFERTVASLVTRDSFSWTPQLSSATTSLTILPAIDPASGEIKSILAPGEYLVFAIGSTTAGTVNFAYYTGTCSAIIRMQ